MAQSPITVTYDITELLQQINGKIDKLSDKVTAIEIGQAEIKADVRAIKEDVKELKEKTKEIDNLKESISNLTGVNSFIKPLAVGILSALVVVLIRAIPYKF